MKLIGMVMRGNGERFMIGREVELCELLFESKMREISLEGELIREWEWVIK